MQARFQKVVWSGPEQYDRLYLNPIRILRSPCRLRVWFQAIVNEPSRNTTDKIVGEFATCFSRQNLMDTEYDAEHFFD